MRLRDFQVDINKKTRAPKGATKTGQATTNMGRNLKKMAELFGEVSESIHSHRARHLLTSALEFVKPHHLALGLRISRLSTTRIEVVVPHRWKNQTDDGEIDPGILTTAATMGSQLLLRRMNQPDLGPLSLEEIHFVRLTPLNGELRGRLELSKIAQEAFRAELKKKGSAKLELMMIFYDSFEKRLADCQMTYHCKAVTSIEWSGETQGEAQ